MGRTPHGTPGREPAGLAGRLLPATPLIGREEEVRALQRDLLQDRVRLLTLTGPPGVGKTRLAIELGSLLEDAFEDGTVLVDLAPLRDARLVARAVADGLGLGGGATEPPQAHLLRAVRERHLLVILDNFEQVLAAAPLVEMLVGAGARLQIVVTSREPLRLACEQQFAVRPLALPDLLRLPSPERLAQNPAVALLLQRARAGAADFVLDGQTAAPVAEICTRLEGLPLAIELAAPWLKVLTPQVMLERLGHRLSLLTRAGRTLPDRHRTLRAAIGWSYALLAEDEARLFRRLAVFVGGCPLGGAEAVEPTGGALDALGGLVDKSLLHQEPQPDGSVRFRMLETVREFAAEQLAASGDHDEAARRHAQFFLADAERTLPALYGAEQVAHLDRLERENDNLRAALGWTIERGQTDLGLRLAGALPLFWYLRGHIGEGRGFLEPLLSHRPVERTLARARALVALGMLAWVQGDLRGAGPPLEEALWICREQGQPGEIAEALRYLGLVARDQGQSDLAAAWLQESLSLFEQAGDRPRAALVLISLGMTAFAQGDQVRAAALMEEALALHRALGNPRGIAFCQVNLGTFARTGGHYRRAAECYSQGLVALRTLHQRDPGVAEALEGLGIIAVDQGHPEHAVRLFGAAAGLRRSQGTRTAPASQADYDRALGAARASLGEEAHTAAWAAGRGLSVDEAIAAAVAPFDRGPGRAAGKGRPASRYHLTAREREVACLVARGLSNREIARALFVSENTAATHVKRILSKLHAHSRAQVAAWVTAEGLLPRNPE